MANIEIGGRLHSTATGNVVTGANEVLDDNQNKKQQEINAELIEAVGTGGSVDSRIAAAVSAAKTELIGDASTDYNTLGKVEDKLEEIEGDIAYIDPTESSPAVVPGFDPTTDTVHVTAQTLSEQQKAQVRTNIGLNDVDAKINEAVASEASRAQAAEADRYTKSETYNKTEVNGLVDTPHQEYVTVDTYASLPATGSKDTIYRVSNYNGSTSQVDASVYSEYAWNGSQYIFLCVKSQIGEVFDISVYNNNAKYSDLADALGTNGEHVPQSLQKGGMSVKFVQSSDNKYVQYRYLLDDASTVATFTNTDNWAESDEGVYIDNSEFRIALTDSNNRIFLGVKENLDIWLAIGVPYQIKEYIYYKLKKLQLDGDKTLSQIIEEIREDIETLTNTKVDKVTGKSLIDEDYAQGVSVIENDEFFDVETDLNNNLLGGRKSNGTKFEKVGYETPYLKTDEADIEKAKLKEVYFTDGIPPQIQEYIDSLINTAGGSNFVDPIQIIESYASKIMSFDDDVTTAVKFHRKLVVAHITDTHNDAQRLTNFANFVEDNSIVDFAIHTGDVDVPARWSTFFNQFSTKDIYLAIGNHEGDACNDHLNAYLTTNFLQNIVNKGVTVTSHNAYYIDRTVVDGNGDPVAGNEGIIRFIFLNEYDYPDTVTRADMTAAGAGGYYNAIFSQEQIDWFISVLKDAITNGYPVVVCSHQKPTPVVQNDKGFFQNPVVNNFASNNYHGTLLLDIINAFKTGGTLNKSYAPRSAYSSLLPTITVNDFFSNAGTFIAWMDGHNHGDYIGYDNVYGNQLILNEVWGSAGVLIGSSNKERLFSDLPRNPDDITQDAFNVYVFDLEYSKVHVIRIGSNLNWEGKIRKYAAYSF